MLRLLFRYLLLPVIALLLLCYAAIPLWVPNLATTLLKPYNLHEIELSVGYPSHQNWHIKQLSWSHTSAAGTLITSLTDVSLAYTWQSIKARQWPTFTIGDALSVIHTNPAGLPLIPSTVLIPSLWLSEWPEFKVDKFNLGIFIQGQPFELSGQLKNQAEGLSILSKISTPAQQQLYLDATLSPDDKVEAKLFATPNSAPVAKITSAIKRQASSYIWQGQGAVNLAYGQKFLSYLLPPDLALTTITQGKLNSHWKITLPADTEAGAEEARPADFDTWLSQAQGELQSQIQLAASNPKVKELYLDASVTQTLNPNTTPQWRLNEGSILRVSPAWDNTKIDPNLYQSLLLEQAQLTFSAGSPVVIETVKQTNILGSNTGLRLQGNINVTLENTHSVYQVFGQLSQLQVHALNHWQGRANLSGYYLAQTEANPWMAQLPIDLRQLQFLSTVEFDFDPKQWQFNVQPNSKVSATQVVSRREAGAVQLFASDKLNLTNDQPIHLAYLPGQDYWTWSNTSVHLRPESIPSQGLEINLEEGSTILSNRPIEGSFTLRPTSVNLPNWPTFQALSSGQLTWLDDQLNINYTAQLPPYISAINGQYIWQANSADHQLLVHVTNVALPPLMPQLNLLENALELPTPLLANITRGSADYEADWRWNNNQIIGRQKLNYADLDAQSTNLHVTGLTGNSQFDYKRTRSNDKNADAKAQIPAQLTGRHQFKADQLSWATGAGTQVLKPNLSLSTKGWSEVQYQVDKVDAKWLGGRVFGQSVAIKPTRLNTLPITVQGIKLNQLIELAKTPTVNATGEVSGVVNITLDLRSSGSHTWAVADADLSSSKTGTIQYTKNTDTDPSDKAAYLEEILSEFQFQHLSAQLTHNEDGVLQLLTRIVGSNERFKEGKKVDFSLTLNPQLR
jgi:hypothetical protein